MHCIWNECAAPPRPPLPAGRTTDVAIIGGGYTGLSAALHLSEAGIAATVLEAEHVGWGASGRNGGFCCLGSSLMSSAEMRARFGEEDRRAYCYAELASVALVADLLKRHEIEADTHSEGETLLAHRPRAMVAMRTAATTLRQDYGVTPLLHEPSDLPGLGMAGPFHGGLTTPVGFALNPRKFVLGLARAAEAAGVALHDASPVITITQNGGFALTTPRGTLNARRLILATNGYSSEDIPDWLRGRYLPLQSNILVTRPLSDDERARQGWTTRQMAYDGRALLHYFRLLPDNRLHFGMRGGVYATPRANARLRKKIHADFEGMFPAWAGVKRPWFWSRLVCLSRNRTPFVGPIPEMPGAFAALAYHGNGLAMATYAGSLLAAMLAGTPSPGSYPRAFAVPPGRIPLGRHRRALLQVSLSALSLAS